MKSEYYFYIYIMSNYTRTAFYTGFTNNIIRRMIEHKYELSKGFVKKYKLKYLVYFEEYQYANDAISREKEIKGWIRKKKTDLIKQSNPNMKDLSEGLFRDYGIAEEEINEYNSEIING